MTNTSWNSRKVWGRATVVNGTLSAIDGIEVLPTSLISNAEADGKMSSVTPANNTLGRALLVYKPDLIHGFKRFTSIYRIPTRIWSI